jgi:hypothetical protein
MHEWKEHLRSRKHHREIGYYKNKGNKKEPL